MSTSTSSNKTWIIWLLLSLAGLGYLLFQFLTPGEQREQFLIGEASHGHFQIELACESCHTSPFGGKEMLQDACVSCHADELKAAHDSHPRKKFTDPRNADLLEIIDARYCVSCHLEHQAEQTREMGVTLPDDYCFHCHQEVGNERPSHANLEFDSCASAGCHNYHDNRALYETFLVEHSGGEWLKPIAERGLPETHLAKKLESVLASQSDQAAPVFTAQKAQHSHVTDDWHDTSHGAAGVSCGACHSDAQQQWIDQPTTEQCATCHATETKGFLSGKHGMRLAAGLEAMTPGKSQLSFDEGAAHAAMSCNACHQAHDFERSFAATEACLGCHADDHSRAFKHSPHAQVMGEANEPEVTCATCHMPRLETDNGEVIVQHNQNDVLRPNEKMIRPVCMQCHSLEFSIDALADPQLIQHNFNAPPSVHIPSVDWARARE
ncbi:MAG: cytochrome c3 family protein [Salinisphaeraceae bacterium]|nr:cytochrome c3 family protein [Salinisphaeraceae bacterium]